MPRLINQPPKYSHHKASGQARVKYAGKVTYLAKWGSPEREEAYARFVAKLPKPEESPTVGSFLKFRVAFRSTAFGQSPKPGWI